MSVETGYQHLVLDEKGIPVIKGTTLKISELVVESFAYGWSPEELHFQHPYLTLGQIHAALAYYWDHADDLNAEIAERLERVENLRKGVRQQDSPLLVKLKAKGLI